MKIAYLVKKKEKLLSFLLIYRTRFILAIITVLVVGPQTPKDNYLLAEFHESGLFTDYVEAKYSLNIVTWLTIFLFLINSITSILK